jgi:SsrA-binding protein
MKIIAQNKKAFFDYQVLETLEAGLVLSGDEVKSIRLGHVSLSGAYAVFKSLELFLINCNVSAYAQAYSKQVDTTQSRKLLLHRRELNRLFGDVSRKGITIIPLKIYLNDRGLVKIALGLCKHKKAADKRESLKEKDLRREAGREARGRTIKD